MWRDYVLETGGLSPYALHRFVYTLAAGDDRPLFADEGDTALVRTTADLSVHAVEVREPVPVEPRLYLFELDASVSYKQKGKRVYPPSRDREPRAHWLARQAERHGFEVLNVRIEGRKRIVDKPERTFAIDNTSFIGVLRVIDTERFHAALAEGIGKTGKAYGSGLLRIERI